MHCEPVLMYVKVGEAWGEVETGVVNGNRKSPCRRKTDKLDVLDALLC